MVRVSVAISKPKRDHPSYPEPINYLAHPVTNARCDSRAEPAEPQEFAFIVSIRLCTIIVAKPGPLSLPSRRFQRSKCSTFVIQDSKQEFFGTHSDKTRGRRRSYPWNRGEAAKW